MMQPGCGWLVVGSPVAREAIRKEEISPWPQKLDELELACQHLQHWW